MKLDLREIIDVPGGRVSFEQELSTERLGSPSILSYDRGPTAEGEVLNTAGVLTARGEIEAEMTCLCDRCGAQFKSEKRLNFEAPVVPMGESEDPEAFELEGDWLDLDDLLETVYILDMDTKYLCREDCKGICPDCGKNLNEGPCSCRKKSDPRLAVLEQLLDI